MVAGIKIGTVADIKSEFPGRIASEFAAEGRHPGPMTERPLRFDPFATPSANDRNLAHLRRSGDVAKSNARTKPLAR